MAGIHKYLWEIGPMSGEFLFNRCCEIYFLFLLNTNGIKWHIENAQTVAIFRRSLPLEAILDRTQPPPPPPPPWMLQPKFLHYLYLIEREKSSTENTFVTSKKSWLFVTDLFMKHQRALVSDLLGWTGGDFKGKFNIFGSFQKVASADRCLLSWHGYKMIMHKQWVFTVGRYSSSSCVTLRRWHTDIKTARDGVELVQS